MRPTLLCLALMVGGSAAAQDANPVRIGPGPPSAQLALGQRLAAAGDFNAIVTAMGGAEIERLARETAGLSNAERARLREIGQRTFERARERLLAAVAATYAVRFSEAQLREIVAFFEGPAGRTYTGALPRLLPEIAQAMQGMDLAAAIRRDFCQETGKLCEARQ